MSFEVPADLRYLDSHEWARVVEGDPADAAAGDVVRVGISDFAQDELGDIVYVELPEAGEKIAKDEAFGVIESVKAVSDLYAPVSGEVVDRNEALFDEPALVNEAPYGDGWMLDVELADAGELDELHDSDEYEDQIE